MAVRIPKGKIIAVNGGHSLRNVGDMKTAFLNAACPHMSEWHPNLHHQTQKSQANCRNI